MTITLEDKCTIIGDFRWNENKNKIFIKADPRIRDYPRRQRRYLGDFSIERLASPDAIFIKLETLKIKT